MNSKTTDKTRKIVLLAILSAIVVILQAISAFIKPGFFPITLSLTPIVIGAAFCGAGGGAFLGLVFSIMVLIDPATVAFLEFNFIGTVITVVLKGVMAGLVSGVIFRVLERKNQYIAALCAAIVSPIVNTGIFFLGCLIFFGKFILPEGDGNLIYVILTVYIGLNFFLELAVNVLLSGTIVTLVKNGRKILR